MTKLSDTQLLILSAVARREGNIALPLPPSLRGGAAKKVIVSRWRALERTQGDARPGPLGGDRRSGRVEAQAGLILRLVGETQDITNEELRRALAGHGHRFGYGTIQRFFARHRITRKKRPRTPASRTDRTS